MSFTATFIDDLYQSTSLFKIFSINSNPTPVVFIFENESVTNFLLFDLNIIQ
jgi:hypothetical protein